MAERVLPPNTTMASAVGTGLGGRCRHSKDWVNRVATQALLLRSRISRAVVAVAIAQRGRRRHASPMVIPSRATANPRGYTSSGNSLERKRNIAKRSVSVTLGYTALGTTLTDFRLMASPHQPGRRSAGAS
jgi:hypothetical protein